MLYSSIVLWSEKYLASFVFGSEKEIRYLVNHRSYLPHYCGYIVSIFSFPLSLYLTLFYGL